MRFGMRSPVVRFCGDSLLQRALPLATVLGAAGVPSLACAAEGGDQVEIINWYHLVAEKVLGQELGARWWPVFASGFALALILVIGVTAGLYRLNPEKMTDEELLPPRRFGVRAFLEMAWNVVSSTLEMIIGESRWQHFAPLLGGTFLFILICNLSGVVPGFAPATEQMNLTFSMGIFIFLAFNFYGLKYAGLNYLKHLMGPVVVLAPLMLVIETISTLARPLSLGLRLFGNIAGDHLVFSVFSTLLKMVGMPWLPLPAALLAFGTLVAALQAFIFMTLSAVYIKLALDTAHTEGHAH